MRKRNASLILHKKSQSAMEYLMTYGWAILIIAVVLGALFQLGVFNAGTFAPKAPPGACQVYRPNGPGTTSFINLEGVCSGELPQYVTNFNLNFPTQATNYISLGTGLNKYETGTNPISFAVWYDLPFYSTAAATANIWGDRLNGGSGQDGYGLEVVAGDRNSQFGNPIGSVSIERDFNSGYTYINNGKALSLGWHFLVVTYDGSTLSLYVDGVSTSSASAGSIVPYSIMVIGASGEGSSIASYGYGTVANFQVYNTSLSANEIQYLYDEGIGGAPIKLQNLVGWWPLNGNANDYSGNNNNGVPSGVTYTNQWTTGYTQP
ncbi:MAG: LamG domain-containing protein [Candidatus Marsarchaeota archaeon]|nr:LamG domain-containing protein [Candidatus Marsarchaeota archaeon]